MCSAHHLAKTFFRRLHHTVNWSHLNDLVLEPLPTGAWNTKVWSLWKWFGGMLVGQCSGQADNIWQYFGLGWAMLWARSGSSGQHFGKGCRAAQLWSTGELLLPGKLRWSICWKVQWLFQNAALKKRPKFYLGKGRFAKPIGVHSASSIINIAVAWCLKFFYTNFVISRNLQIFLRGRDWTEIGVNCL